MLSQWRETLKTHSQEIAVTYLEAGQIRSLTYAQIDALSDTLATSPALANLQKETLIGVFAQPHHPAWMIAILAIWKCGGAALLLNSDLSQEELQYRVQNAGCQGSIICDEFGASVTLEYLKSLPLCIDYPAAIAQQTEHTARTEVLPTSSQLAYVAYTSGSSGKPKAIAITFAGIRPFTYSHLTFLESTGCKHTLLQTATLDFDASWMEFFLLCAGIPCVQWDRTQIPLTQLPAFMQQHQVTTAIWVPSFMADLDPKQFQSLRLLFTTGEACSAEFLAAWRCKIVLAFGPSETTIGCSLGFFRGKMHLGEATEGMRLHILSQKKLKPLKNNKIGQLAISGPGLARGYVVDGHIVDSVGAPGPSPQKPRNQFITCKIDGIKTRVFLTGDAVLRDTDGQLIFQGRTDRQIKIRGKRVEVFGVETAISSALGNSDVRVIPHKITQNGLEKFDYLAAFIISPEKALPFPAADLMRELNQRCPHITELPRKWYTISHRDAFIQKKSGKFDYKKLSACYHDPLGLAAQGITKLSADRTLDPPAHPSLLSTVIGILREIIDPLCTDAEIATASFDDLAGRSSILWTELMNALERRFGFMMQARRQFHFNFSIQALVDDIALQILFSKAWMRAGGTQDRTDSSQNITVFCCPPVSGDSRNFNKIAWKMGVTCYGLMMPPVVAARAKQPDETITASADRQSAYQHYVQRALYQRLELLAEHAFLAMRTLQASGPYILCGYSWGGQLAYQIAAHLQKNHFELGWLGILDSAYPGVLKGLRDPALAPILLNEIYTQVFVFIAGRDTFKINLTPNLEIAVDERATPLEKLEALFRWILSQFEKPPVVANASASQVKQCQQFFHSIYWNLLATLHYEPITQLHNHQNVTLFHTQHNARTCMSAFAPEWQRFFTQPLELDYMGEIQHINLLEHPEFGARLSAAIQKKQPGRHTHTSTLPLISMSELQRMHWNLPKTNPHYVRRPSLETALLTALPGHGTHEPRTVFLTGFGGLGKSDVLSFLLDILKTNQSQPTIEGAHFNIMDFPGTATKNYCFMGSTNLSQSVDILTVLRDLLKERLPSVNGDNLTLPSALDLFYGRYLKSLPGRSLVVFDNVVLNREIMHLLGINLRRNTFIDVLVATRDADIPRGCIEIPIANYEFSLSDSLELLNSYPKVKQWSESDKQRLCLRLNNYPLALDMAASFCDKQDLSCEVYLRNIEGLFDEYLGTAISPMLGIDAHYHQTFIPVIHSTLDIMRQQFDAALLLPSLYCIVCFDEAGVDFTSYQYTMQAYCAPLSIPLNKFVFELESVLTRLHHYNLIKPFSATHRRITPLHMMVCSTIERLFSEKICNFYQKVSLDFHYPRLAIVNNKVDEFFEREGRPFLSRFFKICIRYQTGFTRPMLESVIDLFKIPHKPESLLLLGPPGTGKSWVVNALMLGKSLVSAVSTQSKRERLTAQQSRLYGDVLLTITHFITIELHHISQTTGPQAETGTPGTETTTRRLALEQNTQRNSSKKTTTCAYQSGIGLLFSARTPREETPQTPETHPAGILFGNTSAK
jgi:acyl-coenzyme A synthetase/AMP-(fatty) acid ligase/pimeloyl-ACP methyl ester carboxylesterase